MLEPQLKKQVCKVSGICLILSVICAAVFFGLSLVFDYSLKSAFLGVALGTVTAILSFFVLAVNVSRAVEKSSKSAGASMGFGYLFRLAIAGAAVYAAIKLPNIFNVWATAIPLVFPRLAIYIINFTKKGGDNA